MTVTVRYSDGRSDIYPSVQSAVAHVLREYPTGVIYDAGGFPHDRNDSIDRYDIRNGRVALIWRNEAESLNDDGLRAVASINVEED